MGPVPSRASSPRQLRNDPADAPRDQGTRREERPADGGPAARTDIYARPACPGIAMAGWERRLGRYPAQGTFDGKETAGLPEPLQRHLNAAIRPGSPLTTAVGLTMRGRIQVGRWLPFRASAVTTTSTKSSRSLTSR